jgi:hypothetical protein
MYTETTARQPEPAGNRQGYEAADRLPNSSSWQSDQRLEEQEKRHSRQNIRQGDTYSERTMEGTAEARP